MALTRITQQVLSSTSILAGWHEAFQWQLNAAMALVGFVLAYPRGTLTAAARNAIDFSVDVFDAFGNSFAVATSAASIVRELGTKISFLIQRGAEKQAAAETNTGADTVEPASILGESDPRPLTSNGSTIAAPVECGLVFDEMTAAQLQDVFNIAFDVDQWTDLNMLWPSTCQSLVDD